MIIENATITTYDSSFECPSAWVTAYPFKKMRKRIRKTPSYASVDYTIESREILKSIFTQKVTPTRFKSPKSFQPYSPHLVGLFERERAVFLQEKENFLQNERYRGKYVAILDGNVIDHDENKQELAKRVYRAFGDVVVYIGKVEERERIIEIPSPFF